jgi:hypothetical protein
VDSEEWSAYKIQSKKSQIFNLFYFISFFASDKKGRKDIKKERKKERKEERILGNKNRRDGMTNCGATYFSVRKKNFFFIVFSGFSILFGLCFFELILLHQEFKIQEMPTITCS